MTILFVIIGLSIIILIHEAGHFFVAKAFKVRVDEFGLGFPPRAWGKKIGETIYSINWLPFGGFVKIYGEDGDDGKGGSAHENKRSFMAQAVWKRSAIVLAGVFMNVVLGWLLLTVVFMTGVPEHLMISDIAPNSPAYEAKIQPNDILLSANFNGRVLKDPVNSDDFIQLVKEAGENPLTLTVMRENKTMDITLRGRLNHPAGEGSLGVGLIETGFPKEPFFQSIKDGFIGTGNIIWLVIKGFVSFFGQIFTRPEVLQTVTGPVGIFSIASQAGSLGFAYLLNLLSLISLNLAVLNLIPFPALDGGRFLMFIFEKIKGSPIPKKMQTVVNAVGFTALILLMVLVTIQDVVKLFR